MPRFRNASEICGKRPSRNMVQRARDIRLRFDCMNRNEMLKRVQHDKKKHVIPGPVLNSVQDCFGISNLGMTIS
ncbi:MAG: hypothetical protein A2170_04045 [Deltaproteobacteria bacterium RBG_13_53_10]|nr:MAG: hypothetical protein A2170_04045 [Deltaproteobacteria bacterium RBG_13_53_10]